MSAPPLLPWQAPALGEALARLRTPAAILHAEPGSGQLELALGLARSWLCESPTSVAASQNPVPACGQCGSCHLFDQGHHPDLKVIVPQTLQASLGWDAADDDADDAEAEGGKKRKLSTEIKVEAIRQVVAFAQSTVSRGRAKVVLIHPAERMNTIAANTLLKTLEEPPGAVRFILGCGSLDDLLPTVRSRCQAWRVPTPEPSQVRGWLQVQGSVSLSDADAGLLLAAAGDSPQGALALLNLGWTPALWRSVAADLRRGASGTWAAWPLPELIAMLQKLCHDLARTAAGGVPRYFPADALASTAGTPATGDTLMRLTAWAAELRRAQRHADHPWSQPLKTEALLYQARRALQR